MNFLFWVGFFRVDFPPLIPGEIHRKSPQIVNYYGDSKLLRHSIFYTAGSFGCPTLKTAEKQPKRCRVGPVQGAGKTAEKQPEKQLKQSKQLFFVCVCVCFRCSSGCFSLGNGVRKNGVRNRCPYRRCGVDTEIPYRLPFWREFCWVLPVRVASGVDTEFPYRVRIVDRGVDCRDPVCRHHFRFPDWPIREEHSMDKCRSRLKLQENFERHWSIPISQKTREGYGCFRGLFGGSRGKLRESPGKIAGKFFPNREMLQILGFRAPGKANLPGTLGRHCRDLVPTFRAGCFLKSTVPAFSSFSEFRGNSYGPIIGPYLFLGKFVWTNGPESSSKDSPYTGIGPWMALPSQWSLRGSTFCTTGGAKRRGGLSFWAHTHTHPRAQTQTCPIPRMEPLRIVFRSWSILWMDIVPSTSLGLGKSDTRHVPGTMRRVPALTLRFCPPGDSWGLPESAPASAFGVFFWGLPENAPGSAPESAQELGVPRSAHESASPWEENEEKRGRGHSRVPGHSREHSSLGVPESTPKALAGALSGIPHEALSVNGGRNYNSARCIVKSEAQKSPLFWRFLGFFSQEHLFSRNSTRKPLNLTKSPIFTNTTCKSTCLCNASSLRPAEKSGCLWPYETFLN